MSFHPGGFGPWRYIVMAALLTGGYQLHRHFTIGGLDGLSLQTRSADDRPAVGWVSLAGLGAGDAGSSKAGADDPESSPDGGRSDSGSKPAAKRGTAVSAAATGQRKAGQPRSQNLLIATWAVSGFGPQQLRDPEVMETFVAIVSRFDVLALQQLRATERDFLRNLVARINRDGGRYDYLVGPIDPLAANGGDGGQVAFLFDTTRVVTDRTQLYAVADPDRRLTHQPLVAWFRAAEVDPQRAWTFSLVNWQVDLSRARQEIYELPRLIAAVTSDGRGEDDVIVAGLLQADQAYLAATLGGDKHWFANADKATDIHVKYQTSNLIIDRRMTTEAVLRGGVFDFLRAYNLSLKLAERISENLPVYAEFSPWEG